MLWTGSIFGPYPGPHFLNVDSIVTSKQIILCCRGHPVHFRVINKVPDLHPLDASSTLYYFLSLHNKSSQMQSFKSSFYYLTVSVGQKSRSGLTGSSAQSFTRLQSGCWLGCVFICCLASLTNSYGFLTVSTLEL